jgi:hypothetical protein
MLVSSLNLSLSFNYKKILLQKMVQIRDQFFLYVDPEPELLNVYGAPELIPRNEFRQPM